MEMSLMSLLSVASTAMSAIGAIQQGNNAKAAADYNAGIMEQNATIERQQATAREETQRRQARQILGEQRAGFSQAGIGLGGSASDIMDESATNAELDALTLRYEGDLRARGLMAQAESERFQGRNARTAGYMGAAGSILGGIGGYMGRQEDNRYRSEMLRRTSSPGSYSTPFRGAQ
jgi:hypothetical protein